MNRLCLTPQFKKFYIFLWKSRVNKIFYLEEINEFDSKINVSLGEDPPENFQKSEVNKFNFCSKYNILNLKKILIPWSENQKKNLSLIKNHLREKTWNKLNLLSGFLLFSKSEFFFYENVNPKSIGLVIQGLDQLYSTIWEFFFLPVAISGCTKMTILLCILLM